MGVIQKTYKSGQCLFEEGEPSSSIFIVRKGAVAIQKANQGKNMIEIARIQAGEVIGELSFFDRLPRSATAMALIDVEVIEITFDAMEKIYASIPDYMKTIVASLAERLRQANEQIRILQHKDYHS
jgi:CRP-like cAMP-binding protein